MSDRSAMNVAYALGAYEAVRYIKEVSEILEIDDVKKLLGNEYKRVKVDLYRSIMKDEGAGQ